MSLHRVPAPSRLPATHKILKQCRNFSSTPATLSDHVPPESPSYIRFPKARQAEFSAPPRVRGTMPIPRDIFPRREGDRKVQHEYFKKTIPKRAKGKQATNEVQEWKATMAATRRASLRTGLTALWDRRTRRDEMYAARDLARAEEKERAMNAPEREDDRLTRGTVLKKVLDTKVYADPDRFIKADRARTKVFAMEKTKRDARRDALMDLYANASSFIISEKELQAEIDKTFADDFFNKMSVQAGRLGSTENAWGVYGKPLSIAQMLALTTGTSTRAVHYDESEFDRSAKRHKSVTEELTGGKMA